MNLRVGMVCPYSLSIPGGVQAQVLGLSRQLRRIGHEVRVLGPCDGPPPEAFVTPLGDSLPTAANGSIAPLAPDPAAALRTFRVLRDEQFDVIHVHEPLAPGPSITTVTLHYAPTVGTFHAAGRSTRYRVLGPVLRRLLDRIDQKVVVSKDALALVRGHLGGDPADYTVLFNGVETTEIRAVAPLAHHRPAIFFLGRHEERKGLDVLLRALRLLDLDVSCWVAGDGPDTGRLRVEHGGDPRIEWLGRVSDPEKMARLRGGVGVLRAVAARRVVRRGADRGDGGRHARGRERARRLPQRRHRRRRRPAGAARRRRGAGRRAAAGARPNRRVAAGLVGQGHRSAPTHFAMSTLAHEYVDIYRHLVETKPRLAGRAVGRR